MEPAGRLWSIWVILAGRGFGKTRAGVEFILGRVVRQEAGRIALVADDAKDARDVMIEGESGLLACAHPDWRPRFIPSQAKLVWERTGATAILYSAQDPDSLRGPQHDTSWCDEMGKWRYQKKAWSNLMLGMRLGRPRTVVTTTPTPTDVILELDERRLNGDPSVVFSGGNTYENRMNLAPEFFTEISQYEGTRLGRQELYAEILRDVEGALWTIETLEKTRVRQVPDLCKIVVAVDPAITAGEKSNETGIIVVGLDARTKQHGYALEDVSGRYSPGEWGDKVIEVYQKWQANYVVAEGNQGGEMVRHTVLMAARERQELMPKVKIVHATRGKYTRAEPVAAAQEKGFAHMVGILPKLEDQLTRWVPGEESPDRLDAYVWGMTEVLPVSEYTRRLRTQ